MRSVDDSTYSIVQESQGYNIPKFKFSVVQEQTECSEPSPVGIRADVEIPKGFRPGCGRNEVGFEQFKLLAQAVCRLGSRVLGQR